MTPSKRAASGRSHTTSGQKPTAVDPTPLHDATPAVIVLKPEHTFYDHNTLKRIEVATLSHLNGAGCTVIVDVVAGCQLSLHILDATPRIRERAVVGLVVAV